jgi:hypothetical protein
VDYKRGIFTLFLRLVNNLNNYNSLKGLIQFFKKHHVVEMKMQLEGQLYPWDNLSTGH